MSMYDNCDTLTVVVYLGTKHKYFCYKLEIMEKMQVGAVNHSTTESPTARYIHESGKCYPKMHQMRLKNLGLLSLKQHRQE